MKVARSAALSAVAVTLIIVSACTSVQGSSKTSSSGTSSAASESSGASGSSSEASSPSSSESSSSDFGSGQQTGLVRAKVGEEAKTSLMTVKINKTVDPAPVSSDSLYTPDAGERWVAANISVTNPGPEPLSFSPTFYVEGKTDTNQSVSPELISSYGTSFSSDDLQRGDTAVGDVTFEVPTGQKLKEIDVKCTITIGDDQRTIRFDVPN